MDEAILKINNPPSTFEDIVADPVVIRLYRPQNAYVQKYFKSNSLQLLKYSLSNVNTAVENNSYSNTCQKF